MKVRLELVHKKAQVKKVWLKADTIIGRSTECGLRIASNEVSRQHCKICLGDDGVTVRDLGSSNGTFVNGYQLEPDTDYEIAPDSELSLGGIKFFVRFATPPPRVMQNDGLGSTVDLKPGTHPSPDLPEDAKAEESSEEDIPVAEVGETSPADANEPLPLSETGTVQLAGPNDADYEISTHGDSAILEADDGPETKELPAGTPLPAIPEEQSPEQPPASATKGDPPVKPEPEAGEDVAAFLNEVAEEEPSETDGDESLGDFFKQFD